jgi:hypothetical protein
MTKGFTPKGKGGKKKKKKPREDGETGFSTAYAKLLGVVSEGPIEGPLGGTKGVYLNETPLQNADNSFNFSGVSYDFRPGTGNQEPIPGYGTDVTSETGVGQEVKFNLPVTRQFTNASCDLIRVRLGFQMQEFPPDGGYRRVTMHFRILIKEGLGAFVVRHDQEIEARFSSLTEFEYDFPVNNAGGTVSTFAVRVERVTPQDSDTTRYQRVLSFRAYAEVVAARLSYPYSALVGLQFDSAQFDSMPQGAFEIGGRLLQIPSNAAVAVDRGLHYTGTWDGTFYEAAIAASCPAWIFYDLIINDRYGLGEYIKAEDVDKWSIYELSKYCNELIAIPGTGGGYEGPTYERRYQCNVLLEDKEDATRVIDALRSIFRGFSYWISGVIRLAPDRQRLPTMVVTQSDIVDGMFNWSRTPIRERRTIAHVTWLDPENFYRRTIEVVEDPIGIELYGRRINELSAFGCTSRTQAHRAGWATIISERLELELVQFRLRPYGAIAVPGQVIKTMDVKRSILNYSGLVVAASANEIVLDRPVTLQNAPLTITLTLPDGNIVERVVYTPEGTVTDRLAIQPLEGDIPLSESPWILASTTILPGYYQIISIVRVQGEYGLLYEVSALEYRDDKYGVIDTDYYVPPLPPLPSAPAIPPPVQNLKGTLEDNFSATNLILAAIWQPPTNSDFTTGYTVQYKPFGGEWQGTQQVSFRSASWDVPFNDRGYFVRVASIDYTQTESAWVEAGPIRVINLIKLQIGTSFSLSDRPGVPRLRGRIGWRGTLTAPDAISVDTLRGRVGWRGTLTTTALGPGYSAETLDWQARVQAQGADVSVAGLNAIDAFLTEIDGIDLDLIHLYAGVTGPGSTEIMAGLMVPVRHPSDAIATNSGFTVGQYVQAGATAGLLGDGNAFVNHNYDVGTLHPGFSFFAGAYLKGIGGSGVNTAAVFGASGTGLRQLHLYYRFPDNSCYVTSFRDVGPGVTGAERIIAYTSSSTSALISASRTANNDFRFFVGSTQIDATTDTNSFDSSGLGSLVSFQGGLSGPSSLNSSRRHTLVIAGSGKTPSEIAALQTAAQNLIDAL